ncbi:ATP-binding protein [Streptomyces sp. CBMA29]|uniref:sensor histidine kinase n=1 Tax=Streptomyces sp. CBMA29 TaxID=1896314 RepID=UPI001661AC9B|nr:ATP-binding protein [Streptomyces sp. CBMA29]MBD0738743.1 two-component sensor histidine kinase [Streptomyces sp. CBMA29]
MSWPGRRTLGIQGRLFAGFASALAVAAALMVVIIYVGIRYVPTYELGPAPARSATDLPRSSQPAYPYPYPYPTAQGPSASARPEFGYAETKKIRTKQDVWSTVLTTSVVGLLIVMTLGLGAGWLVSRRLLAPLHTISRAAARARDGNLHYRINAEGPADELRQLADTFDDMLARLEESFAAHQRFAANASHELLTPLATTRAILQVAAKDSTGAELAELTPMLTETNERNIAVVRALLELAGAEHAPFDTSPADLGALAGRVAREREASAAARGITIDRDAESGCAIGGNSALLGQLMANLLDNALTYNHPGGRVEIAVHRDGGDTVVLEVENTGPRVDAATVERLFEPFYRPASRIASDRSGHGLGLAIVRSIALAHGATAEAAANPDGGLTVRVTFPPAAR